MDEKSLRAGQIVFHRLTGERLLLLDHHYPSRDREEWDARLGSYEVIRFRGVELSRQPVSQTSRRPRKS